MKARLLLIAVLFASAFTFGQGNYKGSVSAEVTAEDGSPLPGAVAVLSADTFSRSFVTDANGSVRFVGLVPDTYELRVSFTGFNTYVRPNIIVDTGQNVRLSVKMAPSTQQEEMVVTADSPLMDTTKVGTATVLTEEELNAVPQSRDPWSVIMTVPGVQTDRVNVGGSEAGQQSNFASKGDNGDNASWVMDGVEFVDPAASGGSQTYLDFSAFSQMNVTTGGADVSQRSGGAAMSFVTKQGSNNHEGSIRLLYADKAFQSHHTGLVDHAGETLPGNRIDETFEKSFEIGGPLIKDKLWYWGAFSQNSVANRVINGQLDRTELRNISLKLHGDLTASTRFNAFYTEGDKVKNGRNAGPSRPNNTTWNQSGPTPIYKFELNQLVGQHTELSLLLARVDGGFALEPVGGDNGQIQLSYDTGAWSDTTFINYATKRPVRQYEVKGNTFLSGSTMDHELAYGFSYKEASVNSISTYGEDQVMSFTNDYQAFSARMYRDGNTNTEVNYTSIHLQDTMTYGNWTLKAGLRYDSQEGQNTASSVGANPIVPDLVAGSTFEGSEIPFTWNTIAPRLGVTYTFGDDNQYLVRGSVSQFYDTLSSGRIAGNNPNTPKFSYHSWTDHNGDNLVSADELGDSLRNTATRVLTEIDPDLEAPKTDELLLGFEWAINPEFTVGITGTWRSKDNFIWSRLNGNITSADYVETQVTADVSGNDYHPLPHDGETETYSYWTLDPNSTNPDLFVDRNGDGQINRDDRNNYLTNRPGYSEDYSSIELTATKRLSNRWMLRGNITLQDWTRNVSSEALQNPTDGPSGANEDGASVGVQSAGSGNRSNVYFGSAGWTFNVNGLYQLPWDVTVSANINGREGFAAPYFFLTRVTDDFLGASNTAIKSRPFDEFRFDDMFWADFKLTKTFHMGGRTKVEIAAEVFNAFNADTVMARQLQINSRAGTPAEVLSPRVGRFSATVHF